MIKGSILPPMTSMEMFFVCLLLAGSAIGEACQEAGEAIVNQSDYESGPSGTLN